MRSAIIDTSFSFRILILTVFIILNFALISSTSTSTSYNYNSDNINEGEYQIGRGYLVDSGPGGDNAAGNGNGFGGAPDNETLDPVLIVRTASPINAETPANLLTDHFYTPNNYFFVRNHNDEPEINVEDYQLEVFGHKLKRISLSYEDIIKDFPETEVSATIMCAGNRRGEMNAFKNVSGTLWGGGAIGNAKWTGAALRDILDKAGFDIYKYGTQEGEGECKGYYVQFEGADGNSTTGQPFGSSIPLSYLLDRNFNPILAYKMNGETLPRNHGYPIRLVLPGIVGVRNVKWLVRIIISNEENQSQWMQKDYKVMSPTVTAATVNWSLAPPIMKTPITSFICSHTNGEVVQRGIVPVKGYAWSGGGGAIVCVELSLDLGQTWQTAEKLTSHFGEKENRHRSRSRSWALWEASVEFDTVGAAELWVKAVDENYDQQPNQLSAIYNFRGFLCTVYSKVELNVVES